MFRINNNQLGLTLVELVVTLAVTAIITSVAVPSANRFIDSRRIHAATEAIQAQVFYARTESTKRSEPIYLSVDANDTETWAVGVSETTGCDPAGNDCTLSFDGISDVRVVNSSAFPGVVLGADASGEVIFEPVRATVNATQIELRTDTYTTRVVLTAAGRLFTCSPNGSKKMGRYPDC